MAEVGRDGGGSFTGATLARQWPGDAAPTVAEGIYFPAAGPAVDALAVSDLVLPAPVVGAPALAQVQVLAVSALVLPAPVVGAPALTEVAAPVDAPAGGVARRLRVLPRRVVRLGVSSLRAPPPVVARPALSVAPSDAQIRAELHRRHHARLIADDEDAIAALVAA